MYIYRFNYECPNMFNEADFVISILNSESDRVRKDVDKMCELSSTEQKTKLNYDLFNNQVNYNRLIEYSNTVKFCY